MNSVSYVSSSAHGVGQLVFHLEWCTKYRYKMLRQPRFKDLLAQVLLREADQSGLKVEEMGIGDEHVHLVVDIHPTHCISSVFESLKTESARALFEAEPKFRLRYPKGHFWSPGKFYRSVGDVDLPTVRKYVREQDHRQKQLADYQNAQAA